MIWIPTAFSSLWMTFTAETQSEKPALLISVNDSGLPAFSKIPLLPFVYPASVRTDIAFLGLYA